MMRKLDLRDSKIWFEFVVKYLKMTFPRYLKLFAKFLQIEFEKHILKLFNFRKIE